MQRGAAKRHELLWQTRSTEVTVGVQLGLSNHGRVPPFCGGLGNCSSRGRILRRYLQFELSDQKQVRRCFVNLGTNKMIDSMIG